MLADPPTHPDQRMVVPPACTPLVDHYSAQLVNCWLGSLPIFGDQKWGEVELLREFEAVSDLDLQSRFIEASWCSEWHPLVLVPNHLVGKPHQIDP